MDELIPVSEFSTFDGIEFVEISISDCYSQIARMGRIKNGEVIRKDLISYINSSRYKVRNEDGGYTYSVPAYVKIPTKDVQRCFVGKTGVIYRNYANVVSI